MKPLTAQQSALLDYLKSCERCPSFDEMRAALNLKSKSGIHRLVSALEERGFVRRPYNRWRAIELVEAPTLPEVATLHTIPTSELAKEARRRGLVIGHQITEKVRVGRITRPRKRFVECAA